MEYSIKVTDTGYVETLKIGDKEYHKQWEKTSDGAICISSEFNEQLEESGIKDENLLELIYDTLDGSFMANDVAKLARVLNVV